MFYSVFAGIFVLVFSSYLPTIPFLNFSKLSNARQNIHHSSLALQAAISGGVLKFGSFGLKSKRISPYFFNAGDFYPADLLRAIPTAFAETIIEAGSVLDFDIIFALLTGGFYLRRLDATSLRIWIQTLTGLCVTALIGRRQMVMEREATLWVCR